MQPGAARGTIRDMVILHGATLSFELIDVGRGEQAPLRRHAGFDTLLRVVDGTVRLELEGEERTLTIEDEARIAAGATHRLRNAGNPARVLYELRAAAQ
jgi:quercetin dioxygenase-like cupin family protein